MWLLLIFIGVPIVEIALFIQVGSLIGLWPTLAIVVLSAVAGTTLMRLQGFQALEKLRRSLERGEDPVGPIAHGALILVAGILLLTPGFFTDSIGMLLLIPTVRSIVIDWGAARISVQAASFTHTTGNPPRPEQTGGRSDTIEGDYDVVSDIPEDGPRGSSGWTRPEN